VFQSFADEWTFFYDDFSSFVSAIQKATKTSAGSYSKSNFLLKEACNGFEKLLKPLETSR
jgi:hypothetical protein